MRPSGKIREISPRPALMLLLLLGVVPSSAWSASPPPEARLEMGRSRPKPGAQATPIPFTSTDFIRLTADPPHTTIHLGEPFIVRVRLVNHTKFSIAVVTNFHIAGQLEVNIRPYQGRKARYTGPYPSGSYPNNDYPLFPLEELPVDVMIWGDPKTANGLAFPEPGRYQVDFHLRSVGAQLTGRTGELQAVDGNLRPLAPYEVTVLPPTPQLAPLVEELGKLKAYAYLHLRKISGHDVPAGLSDQLLELVDHFPATPLSPYLDYALALNASNEAGAKLEDPAKFAFAANHYQRAGAADSAYRESALLDLVRLFDKKGQSQLARDTSVQLIKASSPIMATIYGSQTFVKKYLINSAEISPKIYWNILE